MITQEEVFAQFSERLEVIIKAVVPVEETGFRSAMHYVFDIEIWKIHLDFAKYCPTDIIHMSLLIKNNIADRWQKVLADQSAYDSERYQIYFQAVADLFGIEMLRPNPIHPEIDPIQGYEIKKLGKVLEFMPGDPTSKDLVNQLLKEAAERLDPNDQGVSINKYINKLEKDLIPKSYYYWPYNMEKLKLLESLLLEGKFIEQNNHFTETFSTIDGARKNKTRWLKSRTNLFALFYLLYKTHFYQGHTIAVITDQLFLEGSKSTNNARQTSLRTFYKRATKDKYFLETKHKEIVMLVSKLNLRH